MAHTNFYGDKALLFFYNMPSTAAFGALNTNKHDNVIKWLNVLIFFKTFPALLALCAGKSPVNAEFPSQRPRTRSFSVFFDLHLHKRLSKQLWGSWDAIALIMTSL